MSASGTKARDLLYLSTPELWPCWPMLPVVRRTKGEEEMGLVCDLFKLCGRTGYSATVFFANLFDLPMPLALFLALPREVFDTPEEIADAGWTVD